MLRAYQFIPFSVSEIPTGPALVFAPHPDDETFGLGGTILKMTDKGQVVNVVMMTDGAMGGAEEERKEELRKATEILGIKECHFFGAPDQGLHVNPETIQKVIDLLEKYQPRNVFFTSPLEYHPDHRATAWVVWNALQSIGFTGNVFSYEIANQSPVNTLVDISGVMERKTEAMNVYASQQAQLDFVRTITSMNHLRTYTLPPKQVAYAEAFYRFENIRSDLMSYYYGNLNRYHTRMRSIALPLVSVLIRTKDDPALLRQALDSLARQTYRQIEINIVNDGESVQHIVDDFSFSRIYVRNNVRPKGPVRSANTLLKMAQGEYIIFLDVENHFDAHYIENLVQATLDNPNCDLCYGAVEVEEQSEESTYANRPYIPALLRRLDYIPLNSVLFSKKLIEKGCRFDKHFRMYSEWDFLLQLARHADFRYVEDKAALCHVDRMPEQYTPEEAADKEQWRLKVYDKWSKIWSASELDQSFGILEKLESGNGTVAKEASEKVQVPDPQLEILAEEKKVLTEKVEKLSRTNEIQLRRLREFQETIQAYEKEGPKAGAVSEEAFAELKEKNRVLTVKIGQLTKTNEMQLRRLHEFQKQIEKSEKSAAEARKMSVENIEKLKKENRSLQERIAQLSKTHAAQIKRIRELQNIVQEHKRTIEDREKSEAAGEKYLQEIEELKKKVEVLSQEKAAKVIQLQKIKSEETGTVREKEGKSLIPYEKDQEQNDVLLHQLLDERLAQVNAEGEGKRDFKLVSPVGYEKELIELFEEVFKGPMSQEFWKWKYEGVQWRAVCALKDGKIIAHYNGMARDILYFGKHKRAIQPCDTMVSAKARGGIKTNSPFFSSTKAWILSNLGLHKEFLLTYGFPNSRHMRLGEKMGLYTEVDQVRQIDWYTKKKDADPSIHVELFDYNTEADARINKLWNSMAEEFKENIIGIRDAQYLRRRYLKHPLIKYQTYLVSDEKGELQGVFVLRIEDKLAAFMDIIAPTENFGLIIREATRIAHNEGAQLMRAWIPESRVDLFRHANAIVNKTDIVIPTISIVKGLDPNEIKGKWFLTYGDTDFM